VDTSPPRPAGSGFSRLCDHVGWVKTNRVCDTSTGDYIQYDSVCRATPGGPNLWSTQETRITLAKPCQGPPGVTYGTVADSPPAVVNNQPSGDGNTWHPVSPEYPPEVDTSPTPPAGSGLSRLCDHVGWVKTRKVCDKSTGDYIQYDYVCRTSGIYDLWVTQAETRITLAKPCQS
jgi:hypothetical protein